MFTAWIAYNTDFFQSQVPRTRRYLLYCVSYLCYVLGGRLQNLIESSVLNRFMCQFLSVKTKVHFRPPARAGSPATAKCRTFVKSLPKAGPLVNCLIMDTFLTFGPKTWSTAKFWGPKFHFWLLNGKFGRISAKLTEPPAHTGCLKSARYQDLMAGDPRPEIWPDNGPEVLPDKYPF